MAGNSSSLTFKLFGRDVNASKAFKDVGASAKQFGEVVGVGALAAGAAIGAFAVKSISAASDLNETLSKTSVLFGAQSGAIVDWSKTAATSLGASQKEALDAASTFAVFGKSAGLAGTDVTKFAEQNTQLAGDMASFFNTSPQDAIEAIGAAFRGEMEPIRRYGVLLDDASLRNEALALGLTKTTKTVLTPQQRVLAAQALIMKQTTAAQGDFARTSGGLANQQRIMKAEFENASAALGTGLLPIVTKLAVFVTTTVIPAFMALTTWISNNIGVVGPLVAIVGTVILAVKAWTMSQAALNVVLSLNPIGLIIIAIAAFVAAIVVLYNKNETFRNLVQAVWGAIQVAVKKVADFFTTYVWPVIKKAIDFIIAYYTTLWTAFKTLYGWIEPKAKALGDVFKAVGTTIYGAFKTAFNGIASLWNSTVGRLSFSVPDWVPGMGGKGFDVPDIPMLAKGGIVTRPTLAMIGERGPEAVVPLGRGGGLGPTIIVQAMPGSERDVARYIVGALQRYQGAGGKLGFSS